MTHSIRIHHLHEGNSNARQRQNSVYMTIARLIDDKGVEVDRAVARCRHGDAPSRQEGRTLSIGRLLSRHPHVTVRLP